MIQDVLVYVVGALLASVVVAAILYWGFARSRDRGRFVTAATATFIGWVLWRTVLQLSNADNLDVDASSGPLSQRLSPQLWLQHQEPRSLRVARLCFR